VGQIRRKRYHLNICLYYLSYKCYKLIAVESRVRLRQMNSCLYWFILFLFIHVQWGHDGSPPVVIPVETPIGTVSWRWNHYSSWASWTPMGLLFHRCYWALLFILVIKCVVNLTLNTPPWTIDAQLSFIFHQNPNGENEGSNFVML
jgi:hypothetical protein